MNFLLINMEKDKLIERMRKYYEANDTYYKSLDKRTTEYKTYKEWQLNFNK